MTNPILIVAKLILLLASLDLQGYTEGVGAYYAPGVMQEVCERRVSERWNPELDCDWPCLISAIEQEHMGEYWLVDVPGASFHV